MKYREHNQMDRASLGRRHDAFAAEIFESKTLPTNQYDRHLAVVATKIRNLVVSVEVKNCYDISVHCCEQVSSIAELDFSALLDGNFMASPDVIHQEVHQPKLVGEAHH